MAIGENVDFIFLSDITSREGILATIDLLGEAKDRIQIITKIENTSAVENIEEIINLSDVICIDSEKLITELPREKVFLVQKSLFAKCNTVGKLGL